MKPVLLMFALLGVAFYTMAEDRSYQDRHNSLLRACRKENAHRYDAKQFCEGIIGPCGFRGTDQDCFVRLGSQPFQPESSRPAP